jgi:hypothetical protein
MGCTLRMDKENNSGMEITGAYRYRYHVWCRYRQKNRKKILQERVNFFVVSFILIYVLLQVGICMEEKSADTSSSGASTTEPSGGAGGGGAGNSTSDKPQQPGSQQSSPGTSKKSSSIVNKIDVLRDKMQRYLNIAKAPGMSVTSADSIGSSHDTIRSIRLGMLEAPGLHGGASSISKDIGSFRTSSEAWGESYYVKKIFNQKKIVGLSFDPETMICGSCSDGQHRILDPVGGGGG